MYHYVTTQGGQRSLYGLRILEIACGKGAAAYLLKQDCGAAEYMGIDLCPNFIALARDNFRNMQGVQFYVANACELPVKFDGYFDMVICLDAAHGFGGEQGVFNAYDSLFSSIHKTLRPGGLFMFEDVTYKQFHPELHAASKLVAKGGLEILFEEDLTPHIAWPEQSMQSAPIQSCFYIVSQRTDFDDTY